MTDTPLVYDASVRASQPDDETMPDSGSAASHVMPTALVYHPLLPRRPVTCGVITGGVLSEPATWVDASAAVFPASTLPAASRATL